MLPRSAKKSKKGSSNPARSSTLRVVRAARSVQINGRAIERLADLWIAEKVGVPVWAGDKHYLTNDPRRQLEYVILLDALNFCFWPIRGEKWFFEDHGEKTSGYFALALALKKFFEDHSEKGLRDFLNISYAEFAAIFQGGENLQLLKKRWEIARDVAGVIARRYGGDVRKFVAAADGDAGQLTRKIARELPSFDDIAIYGGKKVHLLKRAQILVSDIVGAFGGRGPGRLKNLKYLTAFPDYKLPQLFHHYGVFEYAPNLEKKIVRGAFIKAGSVEEVEIRAATIWAAEWLAEELNCRGMKILPYQTDWLLWEQSQKIILRFPHHRTTTWFY